MPGVEIRNGGMDHVPQTTVDTDAVIIMGSIWNRNEQNFGGEIADKICPYHSF
jgi:hypothetical protein